MLTLFFLFTRLYYSWILKNLVNDLTSRQWCHSSACWFLDSCIPENPGSVESMKGQILKHLPLCPSLLPRNFHRFGKILLKFFISRVLINRCNNGANPFELLQSMNLLAFKHIFIEQSLTISSFISDFKGLN